MVLLAILAGYIGYAYWEGCLWFLAMLVKMAGYVDQYGWLSILDMLAGGLLLLCGYLGYAVKDGWLSMQPA
jgi:hypothetical protein